MADNVWGTVAAWCAISVSLYLGVRSAAQQAQAAREKIRFDLFTRRIELDRRLRDAISQYLNEIQSHTTGGSNEMIFRTMPINNELVTALSEMTFLFGEEVTSAADSLKKLVYEYEDKRQESIDGTIDPTADRMALLNEVRKARSAVPAAQRALAEAIFPYVNFTSYRQASPPTLAGRFHDLRLQIKRERAELAAGFNRPD